MLPACRVRHSRWRRRQTRRPPSASTPHHRTPRPSSGTARTCGRHRWCHAPTRSPANRPAAAYRPGSAPPPRWRCPRRSRRESGTESASLWRPPADRSPQRIRIVSTFPPQPLAAAWAARRIGSTAAHPSPPSRVLSRVRPASPPRPKPARLAAKSILQSTLSSGRSACSERWKEPSMHGNIWRDPSRFSLRSGKSGAGPNARLAPHIAIVRDIVLYTPCADQRRTPGSANAREHVCRPLNRQIASAEVIHASIC